MESLSILGSADESYSDDDDDLDDPTYRLPQQYHIDQPHVPIHHPHYHRKQPRYSPLVSHYMEQSIHQQVQQFTHSCETIESKRRRTFTTSVDDNVGVDDWRIKNEMPGGPSECSVIPSYGGHVARRIWDGVERPLLKSYTRPQSCNSLTTTLGYMLEEAVSDVKKSGLSHLPALMYPDLDMPLISAFVERWQPDTNSFHLPFGEMTIMLHDVWHILRVPVEGDLPSGVNFKSKQAKHSMKANLMDLFSCGVGKKGEKVFAEKKYYVKGGVDFGKLIERIRDSDDPDTQRTAWLLGATGVTLFTDKTRTTVRPLHYSHLLEHCVGATSWGAMTLAFLYRQLGQASRFGCVGVAGCLTLLQAWIYEYFHCFRPHRRRLHIGPDDPRAASWDVHSERTDFRRLLSFRLMLDGMRSDQVTWCPYGNDPARDCPKTLFSGCIWMFDIMEPYMPDRCLRQLGYVQVIPANIMHPDSDARSSNKMAYSVSFSRSSENNWQRFLMSKVNLDYYIKCKRPDDVHIGYLDWYTLRSHPFLISSHTFDTYDSIVQADETSPDWWLDEYVRSFTSLMLLPEDELLQTTQWHDMKLLHQRYLDMRACH